jgi:hypothetical protein
LQSLATNPRHVCDYLPRGKGPKEGSDRSKGDRTGAKGRACYLELRRTLLLGRWVNSPQPTPQSGGYSQRPEVFSEKFSFLLSRLWAGRCTRKEDCVGTRRKVDAARSLGCVCGGALGATTHKPRRSSKGGADVTTTVTGGRTETCAFRAARSTYWLAEWRFPRRTFHALLVLWAGRITYWSASGAQRRTLLPH